MKKAQGTAVKKGDPAAKPPSGDSSGQPPAQPTFSALDIRSEWNPTSVQDSSTVKSPDEEAFLKELEEKFGSKEEAEKLFSRFSMFRQHPLAIPEESKAQPPSSNLGGSQTLDPTHAETGPSPDIEERGKGSSGTEEESVSGFADEIDRMAVDDSLDGVARDGRKPEEGGLLEEVDLEEKPEDSPADLRASRRMVRRSLLDEVDEDDQTKGSGFLAPGATSMQEEETPDSEDEVDAAEERRVAKERKRKGKTTVVPRPRKCQRLISVGKPPRPLPKASGPGDKSSETEEELEEEEEVPNFERKEVWITKKLLGAMSKFNDSKRTQTYKDRSAVGKLAKSGKRYDRDSLREIESDEEFLGHIKGIGFEWLLNHSEQEVPVEAAREFFSTFRFKTTTDPDVNSISFRLFTIEHTMSVREWSLRMGLFSNAEDDEGVWDDRVYGPPRDTPGFSSQTAWEYLTHKRSGTFKTSVSKGIHITDHLLRFAQEFIGYNLMGTASSSITTTELYFTWCMSKRIKVHLGYWLAQACHQMTANPARHMYTCHLLGAYIERNFVMKIGKAEPSVTMCEPPELFSMEYFFNKGLLHMEGQELCFYNIGANVDKEKREPELVEDVVNEDVAELRREMAVVRGDIGEVKKALQEIKGSLDTLAGRSSAQNERMTEAVKLMQKMAVWLGEMFPHVKEKRQPGPGSSSQQQLPPPSRPSVAPLVSPTLASVPVKKSLSRPPVITEEEAPASPAKKKVKVNRPSVPPKSGSQGSRTQN